MPSAGGTSATAAWIGAVDVALAAGGEVERLVVEIETTGPLVVDPAVLAAVETSLASRDEFSVKTVASTIFPNSLWNPSLSRDNLFARYGTIYGRLRKFPQNRNGIYFGRMVGADGGRNQLDFILGTRERGNMRRSAYQAVIFNPEEDLTDQRQRGFPCLHQVSFLPNTDARTLSVIGYYATQNLYEKALGNYLGLGALGAFVAHEWELELSNVTCIAALAKAGGNDAAVAELRRLRQTLGGATQ